MDDKVRIEILETKLDIANHGIYSMNLIIDSQKAIMESQERIIDKYKSLVDKMLKARGLCIDTNPSS